MGQFARVVAAAALAAAALLAQAPGRQKRTVGDAEVMRVHRSAILIDTHNDITGATVAGLDIGQPNTDRMTDLPRMKKGGMGAQFFAAYVAAGYVEGNHAANRNHWADSSGDSNQPNHGLSPFGKEVVAEMNRLGMMVDISHVSDKTFWDALETSRAPIFASHSSCRALAPAPRNMTDEMIAALAKKGGVVQINFSCDFLTAANPRATLADVVQHIDHVVAIGGVGAVGLGSDFDGISCAPVGLDSVDQWPNLTRALLEEGYTAAEIRKIYGENTLRLMAEVERVARSMR